MPPSPRRTPSLHRLLPALLVLLCAAGPVPAAAAAPAPWPHLASDLAPDPAVRFGTLPGGLRYALLPNGTPHGRVSLRLRVAAGSLMEVEADRGLAHFLEHMAFKGSRHMPAGDLVQYLERLGMAFGADTNARTDFDSTVYQLELPAADAALLERGLAVLRETATELLLPQAELERERGVVLSEKRLRDTPASRAFIANLDLLLPGSRLGARLPIGTDASLQAIDRGRMEQFYRTWYRPQRMLLVAVGEFDADALQHQLEAAFSGMDGGPAGTDAPPADQPDEAPLRAAFHHEAGGDATVTIETLGPARGGPETAAVREGEMALYLANSIISRRLATAALRPDAPFLAGAAGTSEFLHAGRLSEIRLSTRPERWADALGVAERQLRAALTHGFTAGELDEARRNLLSDMEQEARAAPTRESRALADELVESVADGRVFSHPADDLALARRQAAAMTPQRLLEALRAQWSQAPRRLFVSGPMVLEDAPARILAAYASAAATAVEPPAQATVHPFAYGDFGPPSAVAERSVSRVLEVTQVRFGNNVHLNLKPTTQEAHSVLVAVRVGSGRLGLPPQLPGLKLLAESAFIAGGLGRHDIDELTRITAGRNVELTAGVDDEAFVLRGRTTPEDLLLQLQLLCAYVSDPGYREEAQQHYLKALSHQYRSLNHSAEGALQRDVAALLRSGDPRFGFPPEAEAARRTLAQLRDWLAPQLREGYLEISVVGDFDPAPALDAVARTFGSLPLRAAVKTVDPSLRAVHFPAARSTRTFTYEGSEPRALALAYWPTVDARAVSETRRLYLLARVFTSRLLERARNQRGLTYVAQVDHNAGFAFPGFGFLSAAVDAGPAQAQELLGEILRVADGLATGPIEADELERARKPLVNEVRRRLEENEFLLTALISASQEDPTRLERIATVFDDLASITAAQLQDTARRYLAPGRALPVLILPGGTAGPGTPADGQSR